MLRFLLIPLVLCVAAPAFAAAPAGDLARLSGQLERLHADLEKGKRFRHVDEETEAQLRELEERMRATIAPAKTFDDLGADAQAMLIADQAELSALLDRVDMDRPRCQPERRTGSNVRQVVCRTKREEDMLRDQQQLQMRKPMGCSGVNCGRE
jgi:hypothetical protein